jgi:hypothetical protein
MAGRRIDWGLNIPCSKGDCACQKLDPTILMMKSAKDRLSNKLAEPVDRPLGRRSLAQGHMCSEPVVIAGVGCKDSAQMGFAEDDGVIKAFPADRADQSLRMPVLPR